MARVLALFLVAVVLVPASYGGVFFRCKMDGELRPTCCCDQEREAAREDETPDTVASSCCCDLVVQAPSEREEASVDPPTRLAQRVELVAVLLASLWSAPDLASPIDSAPPGTRTLGPGVPLFIRVRSLLI